MRGTDLSEVTGMMPGRTGVVTPRSARSSIRPTYSSTSKKNCVTPKSARRSLAASWSRSDCMSGEEGWPAGWAATPIENPPMARASSTSSTAWRSSPGPAAGSVGGSPPRAMRFSTPALRNDTRISASSNRVWATQMRWAMGVSVVVRNMAATRSWVRWRDSRPPR